MMQPMRDGLRVAVTGACGRIGQTLAGYLADRAYQLVLVDLPRRGLDGLRHYGSVIELDLAQRPPIGLFDGIDVVVHLAGEARQDAPWERLLPANIKASYNVAEAAIETGCERVIFASSVHAVFASVHRPLTPEDPVAPANLYGVSKCFVEALAFWCAHSTPISAAAVRIGGYLDVDAIQAGRAQPVADVFIAAPDLMSLLELAISAEYRFAILHAARPGPQALLDIQATETLLGWRPQHGVPPTPER